MNGALVDSPDGEGKTALHHALSQDSPAITKLLLDHGADPDMTSHHGVTARSLAGPNTVNLLVERPRSAEKLSTEKAFLDASKVTREEFWEFVLSISSNLSSNKTSIFFNRILLQGRIWEVWDILNFKKVPKFVNFRLEKVVLDVCYDSNSSAVFG